MNTSPALSTTALSLTGIAPLVVAAVLLPGMVSGLGAWALVALAVAFVPAIFAAFTASQLHARFGDPSTAFRWGREAFGPFGGFLGGAIVVLLCVFLIVSLVMNSMLWLSQVSYSQSSVDEMVLDISGWAVAAVAMIGITVATARGVVLGARFLWVLLGAQLLAMVYATWESATFQDVTEGWPNAGITAREAQEQVQASGEMFLYLVSDMASLVQILTAGVLIFGGWMLGFARRTDTSKNTPNYGVLLALLLNFLVLSAIVLIPGSGWWGMEVSWIPALALLFLALFSVQPLMSMALDTLKAMTDEGLLPSKFASRPFGAWSMLAFLFVSPFALDPSPSGGGQTVVLLLMLFAILSGAACLRLISTTGTRIVASASILFSGIVAVLMIHPNDYTTYALGFNSFPLLFLLIVGLLYVSIKWTVDLERQASAPGLEVASPAD